MLDAAILFGCVLLVIHLQLELPKRLFRPMPPTAGLAPLAALAARRGAVRHLHASEPPGENCLKGAESPKGCRILYVKRYLCRNIRGSALMVLCNLVVLNVLLYVSLIAMTVSQPW